MLTFYDKRPFRQCDGLSRRTFLQVGGLAMGELALPQLLQAEAASGQTSSHKAVIMIYLTGGPPHLDMVDLKPDAPSDIRGEFHPINTSLPGVQISELMPRLAERMDRLVTIRTIVGSDGRHSSFQCVTGRQFANQPQGGWPGFESIVSKLYGPAHPAVPAGVNLFMKMAHGPYNHPGSGFLGAAHQAFVAEGEARANMQLNEVSIERLDERRELLAGFDQFRRNIDRQRSQTSFDPLTEQALNVLTSSRLADALDLDKEDPAIRASYGKDDTKVLSYSHLGYQAIMSKFLLARRLVQAGARCVTATFADFDWHGGNFSNGRRAIPLLDQGLAALIDDLYRHGLENDVTVVVWGEFGRTPKINQSAGRDHWNRNTFALLAGGGMPVGQVIGSTNRYAEEPIDRPVHFQEVFATIYRNLGIDTESTTITDLTGRPRYLVDAGYQPLPELV
ncbi:MAG: DUF1501 domain-containing protein [Planctomycetaceae bacterium]|nr:DUF1501 domain-containing protein [Planctomycetaceae bacterium]